MLPNGKIINFNNRLYYNNKYILNQNDYSELNQSIQQINSNMNNIIDNSIKYGRGTFSNSLSYTVNTNITSFSLLIVCATFYVGDCEFIFLVNNATSNFSSYDADRTSWMGELNVTNYGFTITITTSNIAADDGQYYYAYFT